MQGQSFLSPDPVFQRYLLLPSLLSTLSCLFQTLLHLTGILSPTWFVHFDDILKLPYNIFVCNDLCSQILPHWTQQSISWASGTKRMIRACGLYCIRETCDFQLIFSVLDFLGMLMVAKNKFALSLLGARSLASPCLVENPLLASTFVPSSLLLCSCWQFDTELACWGGSGLR